MELLHPVAMRLEQLKGINGCTIINDAYNSDINALGIALDYMNQQPGSSKVLILSDIQQSGTEKEFLYQQVAQLVKQANISYFVGIGSNLQSCANCFTEVECEFYSGTSDFLEESGWRKLSNQLVLIKGARGFQFERIVSVLSEKNHTTVLETNLNHLNENLNYFRSLLKGNSGLMVMVKALAYG